MNLSIQFCFQKSLGHLLPPTESEFEQFLGNVTRDTTVVMVLQNICSHFDKRWYQYIQNGGIDIAPLPKYWHSHDLAVVVGCKGSCPHWSSIPLPFGYFGRDKEFKKTFSFFVNGTNSEPSGYLDKGMYR